MKAKLTCVFEIDTFSNYILLLPEDLVEASKRLKNEND